MTDDLGFVLFIIYCFANKNKQMPILNLSQYNTVNTFILQKNFYGMKLLEFNLKLTIIWLNFQTSPEQSSLKHFFMHED